MKIFTLKNGKELTHSEYLYGKDYATVPTIPQDIVDTRIKLLNNQLAIELTVHYTTRDTQRIAHIQKAIKFWSTLDKEIVWQYYH